MLLVLIILKSAFSFLKDTAILKNQTSTIPKSSLLDAWSSENFISLPFLGMNSLLD